MPAANKGGSPREGDETYLEAHERYGRMRAEEGLPTDAGGTRIVTRYDDVSFALKNVDSFGGTLGYNPELPDDVQILPSIPEPRHGRVRRVISGVIAPHRLAPVEPFVAALSEQLLSKIIGLGPVDLVPSLVDPIPTEAMAFVFGIPREDAAALVKCPTSSWRRSSASWIQASEQYIPNSPVTWKS